MKLFSWFQTSRSITLQTARYSDRDKKVSLVMKHKDYGHSVDVDQHVSLITKENKYNRKLESLTYKEPKGYLVTSCKSQQSSCGLIAIYVLTALSIVMASLMWTTNWYRMAIYKGLVFSEHSINVNMWKNPNWQPLVNIHIFNYTNKDAILAGTEKPNVEEVGPYVFREKSKKVNVTFHANGTVSYQNYRTYTFHQELSAGSLNDSIITPNVILFSATSMMKGKNSFEKFMFTNLANAINIPVFNNMSANDLILGYEDWFSKLGSKVKLLLGQNTPSKFGLLLKRIGLNEGVITMHTGKNDMNLYGIYDKFNGKSDFGKWNSDECDRLDGTDGTIYPPMLVERKLPLSVFSEGSCRTSKLYYNKEITTRGLPAMQYVLDPNMFEHPKNSCYCMEEECPAKGVQSISPCVFGGPIFISQPHFANSDETIRNGVSGLRPEIKRNNYFEIHRNLGVLVGGKTTMQLNVRAQNTEVIPNQSGIKEGTYLPIAWIELDLSSPPADMIRLIFITTWAMKFVEIFLKYAWIIMLCVCALCYKQRTKHGLQTYRGNVRARLS